MTVNVPFMSVCTSHLNSYAPAASAADGVHAMRGPAEDLAPEDVAAALLDRDVVRHRVLVVEVDGERLVGRCRDLGRRELQVLRDDLRAVGRERDRGTPTGWPWPTHSPRRPGRGARGRGAERSASWDDLSWRCRCVLRPAAPGGAAGQSIERAGCYAWAAPGTNRVPNRTTFFAIAIGEPSTKRLSAMATTAITTSSPKEM